MAEHGWDIVEVPPTDDSPDGVFVGDSAVVFGATAVLARPGADSRQAEVSGADEIDDLGYTPVPVDISEYEKRKGCVTCLSIRLRPAP